MHGRGEQNEQGFNVEARRKELLGRPKRRWEDGIRIGLREIGWGVSSGYSWLRIGTGGGCCEYGDESSGSGVTELVGYFALLIEFAAILYQFRMSVVNLYQPKLEIHNHEV
jgi:hypothetical protein